MKRLVCSSSVSDDRICRKFAARISKIAFEYSKLNVGFRLANKSIMFTVYHDEDRVAPHFGYNVSYDDVLDAQGDEESVADLIDEIVIALTDKAAKSL